MSFTRKRLEFDIILSGGQFGSGGGNTSRISGARANVRIAKAGGRDMGRMEAAIFGMTLSEMNKLTTFGTEADLVTKNGIKVFAYDEGQQPALIFSGTIGTGYADMRAMPEVCFRVSAFAGLYESVQKTDPTSKPGPSDVKEVMGDLAKRMGLQFEGNDIDIKIPNLYLSGSPRQQAMKLAEMAGVQWVIDNDTLAIWKSGASRQGGSIPLISPTTGLVGYPAFNQAGVVLTTMFNPSLRPGGKIKVKSDLTPACGEWFISNLEYDLDSETPRGKWFSIVEAQRLAGLQTAGG
ncbi:baseplate hub protein [Methylobacterium sp. JK268]